MVNQLVVAEQQLANRRTTQAQAIDAWVSLALENSDPEAWANALIASALDRLNTVQETPPVKAEARLQILDTRRAILSGITKSQNKHPPLQTTGQSDRQTSQSGRNRVTGRPSSAKGLYRQGSGR